jgi:hypothetical protein
MLSPQYLIRRAKIRTMRVDLNEEMLDKKAGLHITFNSTPRQ